MGKPPHLPYLRLVNSNMPTFTIHELETDSIKLIPLTEFDFERLYAVASDPLIWEQHPSPDRYQREVFTSYFEGAVKSGTAFIILHKPTGQVMGSTRFYEYKLEESSIAIGYTFLARAYWGGSYNQTIKKMLLDHAFQFVNKVYFHIGAANIRSQKAILKTGATLVGEHELESNGHKRIHLEYIIRKEDWTFTNL